MKSHITDKTSLEIILMEITVITRLGARFSLILVTITIPEIKLRILPEI